MGAYCSVYNDTNDVMYIKYGPNMGALQWATIAAGIAATMATFGAAGPAAAGGVAATSTGLGLATRVFDTELKKNGYSAISPGGTYKSEKLTLSLFLQANIVLKGSGGARRGTLDCWTGPTDNSCHQYNASQVLAAAADEYRCFVGGFAWATIDGGLAEAFRPFGRHVRLSSKWKLGARGWKLYMQCDGNWTCDYRNGCYDQSVK